MHKTKISPLQAAAAAPMQKRIVRKTIGEQVPHRFWRTIIRHKNSLKEVGAVLAHIIAKGQTKNPKSVILARRSPQLSAMLQ